MQVALPCSICSSKMPLTRQATSARFGVTTNSGGQTTIFTAYLPPGSLYAVSYLQNFNTFSEPSARALVSSSDNPPEPECDPQLSIYLHHQSNFIFTQAASSTEGITVYAPNKVYPGKPTVPRQYAGRPALTSAGRYPALRSIPVCHRSRFAALYISFINSIKPETIVLNSKVSKSCVILRRVWCSLRVSHAMCLGRRIAPELPPR